MHDIHIAGTGVWHPEDMITNDEIVESYNSYVDSFNQNNKTEIDNGILEKMPPSSSEFIEKASGIQTRYVIDKAGILDPKRMMPIVKNEDESRLSIHAEVGIIAAHKVMRIISPDKWIIESKSLKLFFNSYRDSKSFHENTTIEIVEAINKLLNPV